MTGLTVPPTVPASANSIVAQFRARPKDGFTKDVSHYTIPPMSLVFATETDEELNKPALDHVRNASAHIECISDDSTPITLHRFRGVSIEGLPGRQAHAHGNNDRFTAIVRGEATIMVDYEQIENIDIGAYIGLEPRGNTGSIKQNTFQNFIDCPTVTLKKAANSSDAIGILIRKPDKRRPENWATVHLL